MKTANPSREDQWVKLNADKPNFPRRLCMFRLIDALVPDEHRGYYLEWLETWDPEPFRTYSYSEAVTKLKGVTFKPVTWINIRDIG